MKEVYEDVKIRVVVFDTEDVITDSCSNKLPYVPVCDPNT